MQVASMSHGFGRTMNDPVYHYHSIYDSQRWEELYADPGFFRHVCSLPLTRMGDCLPSSANPGCRGEAFGSCDSSSDRLYRVTSQYDTLFV